MCDQLIPQHLLLLLWLQDSDSEAGYEDASQDSDLEEEEGDGEGSDIVEQRWVPYRHTNGVAIYHHEGPSSAAEGVGSEYMASSIVRGSPDECLAVLMDLRSNTTILGPASQIELLEEEQERQVSRSRQATGHTWAQQHLDSDAVP
jgi:hypothetical protein